MVKKFFPLILGLIWLITRWVLYLSIGKNDPETARNAGVILNLFFIIVVIFNVLLGLYRNRAVAFSQSFMEQFKLVLKESMKYSLSVGIGLVIFYNFISTELSDKRKQDYEAIEIALDSEEKINAIKAENFRLKDFTKEQIRQAAKERTDLFTNEKVVSSASFLVTVFASLIYALFSVILFRFLLKSRAAR